MERKLASMQRVVSISPIEGADRIEVARVLGWDCVVQKGEYKPGDWCIYVEIDSILPEVPELEFMAVRKYKVKTIRLKGQISQGLLISVKTAQDIHQRLVTAGRIKDIQGKLADEGADWTEALGILKYEPPIPEALKGKVKGNFPTFIMPKTDEPRIQSHPHLVEEFQGRIVYVTTKVDGTSSTYIFDGELFRVCSRNIELSETKDNIYWKMAEKYDIEKKLRGIFEKTGKRYAIQGETCGHGIQNNRMALQEHKLYVFNVFDVDSHKYLNLKDMQMFCELYDFEMVPLIYSYKEFDWKDVDSLLVEAQGFYETGHPREGIVIRTIEEGVSGVLRGGRMSFKAINNKYLLKVEE